MDFYQYIVELSTVLATFLLLLSAETVTETTNQAEVQRIPTTGD